MHAASLASCFSFCSRANPANQARVPSTLCMHSQFIQGKEPLRCSSSLANSSQEKSSRIHAFLGGAGTGSLRRSKELGDQKKQINSTNRSKRTNSTSTSSVTGSSSSNLSIGGPGSASSSHCGSSSNGSKTKVNGSSSPSSSSSSSNGSQPRVKGSGSPSSSSSSSSNDSQTKVKGSGNPSSSSSSNGSQPKVKGSGSPSSSSSSSNGSQTKVKGSGSPSSSSNNSSHPNVKGSDSPSRSSSSSSSSSNTSETEVKGVGSPSSSSNGIQTKVTGSGSPSSSSRSHSNGGSGSSSSSGQTKIKGQNIKKKIRPTFLSKVETVQKLAAKCSSHGHVFDHINLCVAMSKLASLASTPDSTVVKTGTLDTDSRAVVEVLLNLATEVGASKFTTDSAGSFLWGLGKTGWQYDRGSEDRTKDLEAFCAQLAAIVAAPSETVNPRATRHLCTTVSALAKIGRGAPAEPAKRMLPTWKLLLRTCCQHLNKLGPRELSNIMWSMAAADVYDSIAWDTLASRMRILMPRANSQDISNMMWASARLGHRDDELFTSVVRCCTPNLLKSMDSQELSNIIWAMEKLQLDEPDLLMRLVCRIEGSPLQSYKTNQLVMLLYTLVKLKAISPRFFVQAASVLRQRAPELTYYELSTAAWSFAMADQLIKRGVSTPVDSLGSLWGNMRAGDHQVDGVLRNISISPGDVTQLSRSFSACFEEMSYRVVALSNEFMSQRAVTSLLWAFSKIGGHCSQQACTALCVQMARHVSLMKPGSLAVSLWSLASVGHSAPRALLQAASLSAASVMHQFKARDLSNLLLALAELGYYDFDLFAVASIQLRTPIAQEVKRSTARQNMRVGHLPMQTSPAATIESKQTETSKSGSGQVMTEGDQQNASHHDGGIDTESLPRTRSLLQLMNPLEVGKLAWAFAKVGHVDEELFTRIKHIMSAAAFSNRLSAGTLSRTMWAFTTLGQYDCRFFDRLARRAEALEDTWEPSDTTRILRSLAVTEHPRARMLINSCLRQVERRLKYYAPNERATVAWALASLSKVEGPALYRPKVLTYICEGIQHDGSVYSFEDLSNIMWALMVFRQYEPETSVAVYKGVLPHFRVAATSQQGAEQAGDSMKHGGDGTTLVGDGTKSAGGGTVLSAASASSGSHANSAEPKPKPNLPPACVADLVYSMACFSSYHRTVFTEAAKKLMNELYELDIEQLITCVWTFSISLHWTKSEKHQPADLVHAARQPQAVAVAEPERTGVTLRRWLTRRRQAEMAAEQWNSGQNKTERRRRHRHQLVLKRYEGDEEALEAARNTRAKVSAEVHVSLIQAASRILWDVATDPSRFTRKELMMLWQSHACCQDWFSSSCSSSLGIDASPLSLRPPVLKAALDACLEDPDMPGHKRMPTCKRLLIEVSMLLGELGYRASLSTAVRNSAAVLSADASSTAFVEAEDSVLSDPDIISFRLLQPATSSSGPSLKEGAISAAAAVAAVVPSKVALLLASDHHLVQSKRTLLAEVEVNLSMLHRRGWHVAILQLVEWGLLEGKEAKLQYLRRQIASGVFAELH